MHVEKTLDESIVERISELLWDSLKRDPEHKDRRQTGWGTKTKIGLAGCVVRVVVEWQEDQSN